MSEINSDGERDNAIRVLVVDDIDVARDALEIFLSAQDDVLPIGKARDGVQALDLCTQAQPDIVLMDIKMPIMDGITAARIIRQRYPNIRVILISNSIDGRQRERALEAGAFAYLSKGAATHEIISCIRAAMNRPLPRPSMH